MYLKLGQKIFLPSCVLKIDILGFSGGSVVKNPPANAGDTSSITDLGRVPVSWETCTQVKKQQLELDMEQGTGSKLEKSKSRLYSVTMIF